MKTPLWVGLAIGAAFALPWVLLTTCGPAQQGARASDRAVEWVVLEHPGLTTVGVARGIDREAGVVLYLYRGFAITAVYDSALAARLAP